MTSPVDLGIEDTPPPPMETIRGVDYPKPDADASAKKSFLTKLLGQTKPTADLLTRQATKHAHYANGRMWLDWNTTRREWYDRPLDEHEIRVAINHIRPMLRSKTQRLLSSRVDFTLVPSSNDLEERDRCKAGTSFLDSRWEMLKMSRKLDVALEHAQYAGFSVLKSFWNPKLGPLTPAIIQQPKMQPVTDEMGQPQLDPTTGQPAEQPTGEMQDVPVGLEPGTGAIVPVEREEDAVRYRQGDTDIAIRTVFNVRWNPEATGWSPSEGLRYVLDLDEVPLSLAKERYPQIAANITASGEQKSGNAQEARYNTAGLTTSGATPGIAPAAKEPVCQIIEYWELESVYFPKGRLITMVGDAEAYDGDFPDAVLPFDPVYDEPAPGTPAGRSGITDMIDPSDVINRQWTAIVQEQQDAGTGQYIGLDIPGVPDQLSREPRQILKFPLRSAMQGRGVRDLFARVDPPAVSPDRWRLIEAAERTLQDIGAYHEVTRGQVPPGVDSGVAITKLQEQEDGQLRKAMLALEETVISVARKQLAIAKAHYKDTKRWLPVKRKDLGYMVEGVTGLDLPDPETVSIVLDRFRPHSDAAFRADIKEIMGLPNSPLTGMVGLKMMDIGRGIDGVFESQTRHYSKARWENLQIERGVAQFIELGETDPEPVVDPMGQTQPGIPEPVVGLAVPAAIPEDGSEPTIEQQAGQMVPCLLPFDDDHAIHMEVLDELVLDVTKSWALRQMAMAHKQEHREAIAKQQMAQSQAQAPGVAA